MKYHALHDWNVNPSEAISIQQGLKEKIHICPFRKTVHLIAGADISFNLGSNHVYAVFVILDLVTLRLVHSSSAESEVTFPYIPGLLSFREIPPLIEAWKKLEVRPDVVVLDGQGIAHPRRLGIASHFGLMIEVPTIGCGKSLLVGKYESLGQAAGNWTPLVHHGDTIGAVLRTRANTNPVFISPGNRIDLESAIPIILAATRGYRIPEPTRQAHLWANQLRRGAA